MSKATKHEPYLPIRRVVENGGITFDREHLKHDALRAHEGRLVLCDLEKDVDTEKLSFRIYAVNGEAICSVEIGNG
jgi:hypothetical protein